MEVKKEQTEAHNCSGFRKKMGYKFSESFRQRIRSEYLKSGSISQVSKLLHINRVTVRRWLRTSEPKPRPISEGQKFLRENSEKILKLFEDSGQNDSVLQRLIKQKWSKDIPLRMLERFTKSAREQLNRTERTIRFETTPGKQMQIDFGEKDVVIGGDVRRIHFFVGVLSYSRRSFAKAYWVENQDAWLDGIESALHYFGGVPCWIVSDNTKCLISNRRNCGFEKFGERVQLLCSHYRTGIVPTAPYKPRSKGKVERQVRYIKENALVGTDFKNLKDLNHWLQQWEQDFADKRVLREFASEQNTPQERFTLEKKQLGQLNSKLFEVKYEERKADEKARIQIENQKYELPEEFANQIVQVQIGYSRTSVVAAGTTRHFNLNRAKVLYLKETDKWTHLSAVSNGRISTFPIGGISKRLNMTGVASKASLLTRNYDRLCGISKDKKSKE